MTWLGLKEVAFILARVNGFPAPPANWENLARQRIFFDPDPAGFDRSLRAFIRTVSYGRARLGGEIYGPYDVQPWMRPNGTIDCAGTMNLAIRTAGLSNENPTSANNAIRAAQGLIVGFSYACVIFTDGAPCSAHGWWGFGPDHFHPGSTVIGFSHVRMNDSLGILAMENIHSLASFGDLYGIPDDPGNFDVMSCSCGTHPSSFTKIKLGWLDSNDLTIIPPGSGAQAVNVHALALPSQPGRVHAIKIPSARSKGYFLVEARLRVDLFEAGMRGVSAGIPSEGIVVYWIDESSWPPVHLRTPTALSSAGATFSDQSEGVEVKVASQIPNGFAVEIRLPDVLHLLGVTSDGRLWHTIRYETFWDPFGDVKAASSDPGTILEADCALVQRELHVCAVTNDGRLWHTIRRADGSWFPFGDVKAASNDPGTLVKVGIAEVNGELHVCAVTNDGRLWHTIRHETFWDPFGDVQEQTGNVGAIVGVDCASVNGELHVSGLAMSGFLWSSDGRIWHTIRHAASWEPFGDVEGQAGERGSFQSISVD